MWEIERIQEALEGLSLDRDASYGMEPDDNEGNHDHEDDPDTCPYQVVNRGLDDSMWLGRAHSLGHARQMVNLLGYALMVNGLALLEHRARSQLAETA